MKTKKYLIAIAIFGGFLFTALAFTSVIDQNEQRTAKIDKKPRPIIADAKIDKKPRPIIADARIDKKPRPIIADARIDKKPRPIIA